MNHWWLAILIVISTIFSSKANTDSLLHKKWIKDKFAIGRSQHIQYFTNDKKTKTFFNKAYNVYFMPVKLKGFKPFIALSYEYFFTKAVCYTCSVPDTVKQIIKPLHFINFSTLGIGISYGFSFKNKKGKDIEFILAASLERFLFRFATIYNVANAVNKATPFVSTNKFFNQYFFKDAIGMRVYQTKNYKVFTQFSGILLRNERLYYAPSNHTFHNFMFGFNVFFK
ncbi:MAG TPA: hypothetical protein PK323_08825 [Bacteroidia bacterium]|nr:hypothetical protein [Bacteroidia bacterium]